MNDDSYGRGKRVHIPNAAIQTHLATVQRTHKTVENNRRKANIKQQRAAMAAEKAAKEKRADTTTSKSSARSKAPNDLGDDDQPSSEVDPIEEELKADEAACAYLIRKITARDKTRNVKYLDLHELETIWERMQREPAPALKKNPKVQTLGTVELTTSSAPSKSKSATTATAKRPLPKQAAQNPVRSGDPARSAPSKSATATASKNNSRDKSDQPLLPPKSAKPAAKSAASSSVPRTAYSKAKPPPMTPGVHYEEIPLDDESDADETFGGINQGDDDQGDDDQGDDHGEEEAPVGVKAKKSKNNCKATKDYTDPVLQNLISVVCEHLIPKALKVGLCIPPAKLDPLIHECWNLGLEELQLENSQYSCTHQNRETIKTRLQSNRSHARNRAFITAPAIFGFHGKPLKEQAASAAKLLPSEFLRNPEAETGGKFQHPFIAGLLAHCLLKGRKPPGERYPEYFRVMPLESIAFACAMMQYALEQIQLGAPKQDKLDFAKYQTRFSTHLHSLQTFQKERPTLVGTIQKKLWITIMESVGKEDQLADPSEPPLGALTAHDFDDEEEPTPEELAALDMGASRVAKAEPSCHATHTGKGKGKAHGPSIDSDEEHRGVFYSGGNNVANVSRTWSPPPVRPDDDDDNGAGPGPSTSTKAHKLRDESETSETTSSESDSESTGTGSDASERRKDHKERKKRKEHRRERRRERRKERRAKRKERKERKAREAAAGHEREENSDEGPPAGDVNIPAAHDEGEKPDIGENAGGGVDTEMDDGLDGKGNNPGLRSGTGDVAGYVVGDGGDVAMGDESSPIKKRRPKKRPLLVDSDESLPEPDAPAAPANTIEPNAKEAQPTQPSAMAKGKQTAEGKRRKGTKAATAVDQQADASAALRRTPRAVRPPDRGPQVLTAAARR